MEYKTDAVLDIRGNAIFNASVRVLTESKELATIYDANENQVNNPLGTDATGEFSVAVPNGKYFYEISVNGKIYETRGPISFFDPMDDGASSIGYGDRTVSDKLGEVVSVKDSPFNAKGDGVTDDSEAFQAAVDSLPASGGRISVISGNYVVNTAPIVGSKSVYWDFGPDVTITGTQTTFPKMATNGDCTVNGPYIRAQRANPTIDGAASFAMGIESIQPASDTNNGYGALYVGAQTNAPGNHSINSAINAVATANPGSSGNVFGIEIDVATFATPGTGTQFGLLISGFGGNDCTFGIRINRYDGGTSKYLYGIAIAHARIGLFIDDKNAALENGLVLGDPPARYSNQMVQAMQISNGGNVLLLQRRTNTSPTGNFFSCINADNSAQLSALDVLGNFFAQRVQGTYFRATGAPVAQPSGQIGIGAQTSSTATAGTITPPAQVAGYLSMYIGPTLYKVPYYAA